MGTEKNEAEIQADYRDKVARMPPDLVARYVPLIKAYERTVLRFHKELAAIAVFDDADIEALENDFRLQHPMPTGDQDVKLWQAECQVFVNTGLDARFPGVRLQIEELSADFGPQFEALATPFSIENFMADGGTQEQLNDLHQAVLWGIFSRPRAPQGPVPA